MDSTQQLHPGVVLQTGERVLWKGEPFSGLFAFRGLDTFLIPFSLFWAGFATFWNVTVWVSGVTIFFRLFGLPFLLVGAYVTVGRFLYNKIQRSRTSYVLTDRRAIILLGDGKRIREHRLANLGGYETSVRADGSGSIDFGPSSSGLIATISQNASGWGVWKGPGVAGNDFYRIEDVQHVIALLQEATYQQQ